MKKIFWRNGWLLGLVLGVAYGICLRILFELGKYFPGALSFSFVFIAPLGMGLISVYFSGTNQKISTSYKIFMPWVSIFAFMATCMLVSLEGFVCVVLLSPIFLFLASLGGLIGGYLYNSKYENSNNALKVFALLPIVVALGEVYVKEPDTLHSLTRSVVVDAPEEKVWAHIKNIPDIKREEFSASFLYLIGVPYPVLGQFNETAQTRLSRWEKGIEFEEKVVEHVNNHYMRWVYDFKPGNIPADALDQHVTIGGKYFDVIDTSYTTRKLSPTQTELSLQIRYRVSTNINIYANFWANYLVSDFENQILTVYKHRSEG